eukprot:216191_1
MSEFHYNQNNKPDISNQEWKCSSCSFINSSNRNIIPCRNCLNLDSDTNLKRARALYILGNITKPSVSLIPLKTPFFIYPLSPPMISHILNYDCERDTSNVMIYFNVELWDTKNIEKYHIESIKVDYFADTANSNRKKLSTIIYNRSPYNHIFCVHIENVKQTVKTFEIDAKCYNSRYIAPKTKYQIMFHNIRSRKRKLDKSTTNINTQPLKRHKNDKMISCHANDVSVSEKNNYNYQSTTTSGLSVNVDTTNLSQSQNINVNDNVSENNLHKTAESLRVAKWYKWYWIDDNGRHVEGQW